MGIKTDYLKDCATLETITVQELVDMKRNSLSSSNLSDGIDSLKKEIEDKIEDFRNEIDEKLDDNLDKVDAKLVSVDIKLSEFDKKLSDLEKDINEKIRVLSLKLDEIYNKVTKFQFFNTKEIIRNKIMI